jgi:GH25 family lysozyme M1 (1,4-beta-N-acetylmuramidase)
VTYLFGIDYASYQGFPNFALLRDEGHDFAIVKVTGEGSYVNPNWSTNRDRARAAGLIVGTYDWVEPQSAQSGAEAALDYLRVVGPRLPGDLLCVDFETPEWALGPLGTEIEPWMREYLYTLRDRAGQPVIIYSAPYFLNETGANTWGWMGQDFSYWLAAPGPAAMLPDDAPWPGSRLFGPWTKIVLHQHQWHATSPAVVGEFDRDRFQGTRAELAAHGAPAHDDPIVASTTIGSDGVPVTTIRWGGQATKVLGTDYVNIGVRVQNAAGDIYHRSILHGQGQEYVEE